MYLREYLILAFLFSLFLHLDSKKDICLVLRLSHGPTVDGRSRNLSIALDEVSALFHIARRKKINYQQCKLMIAKKKKQVKLFGIIGINQHKNPSWWVRRMKQKESVEIIFNIDVRI